MIGYPPNQAESDPATATREAQNSGSRRARECGYAGQDTGTIRPIRAARSEGWPTPVQRLRVSTNHGQAPRRCVLRIAASFSLSNLAGSWVGEFDLRAARDSQKTAVCKGFVLNGAAQESNLPTVGSQRPAGFEDRMGHRARAAPGIPQPTGLPCRPAPARRRDAGSSSTASARPRCALSPASAPVSPRSARAGRRPPRHRARG